MGEKICIKVKNLHIHIHDDNREILAAIKEWHQREIKQAVKDIKKVTKDIENIPITP